MKCCNHDSFDCSKKTIDKTTFLCYVYVMNIYSEKPTEALNMKISKSIMKRLNERSKEYNVSKADIVRAAIKEHLNKKVKE